jgi:predicted ATPase
MFAFNLVRGDMHATRANVDELLAIAHRLDDLDLLVVAKMALLVLAQEQSLGALVAWGPWFQGWALAQQGKLEEGIARMRQGIAGWHTVGAGLAMPYCRTFLAEFPGLVGRPEEGLEEIAIVEAQIDRWGEVIAEAEVQRVKGELLLKLTPPDAMGAEACFLKALETARHRSAKSWELRAATSFARLWQQQGKRHEARAVLTPVYQWFTEGFDTADLQAAKALLDVLL